MCAVFVCNISVTDMPELPLATQEAYGMPASVAPDIVDELAISGDAADQSSRMSLLPTDNSNMVSLMRTPSSPVLHVPDQTNLSPVHNSPVVSTPALAPYEGAAGSDDDGDDGDGDDDDDDNDDGCDINEDVSDLEQDDDTTLEPVSNNQLACILLLTV